MGEGIAVFYRWKNRSSIQQAIQFRPVEGRQVVQTFRKSAQLRNRTHTYPASSSGMGLSAVTKVKRLCDSPAGAPVLGVGNLRALPIERSRVYWVRNEVRVGLTEGRSEPAKAWCRLPSGNDSSVIRSRRDFRMRITRFPNKDF